MTGAVSGASPATAARPIEPASTAGSSPTFVSPNGGRPVLADARLAPGIPPGGDARLALVSNTRHHVDLLLRCVEPHLPSVLRPHHWRTDNAAASLGGLLDQIASEVDAAVIAIAEGGAPTSQAVADALAFEAAGAPCALVAARSFADLALYEAACRGADRIRLVVVDGSLASMAPEAVERLGLDVAAGVARALAGDGDPTGRDSAAAASAIAGAPNGDGEEFQAFALDCGWSDGLPVLAPTAERVATMVRMLVGRSEGDDRGGGRAIPPAGRLATIESIAANAVLAGCRPAWFPVIVAAVDACLDPDFNLQGIQTTTHNASTLLVVSGPARQLGYNAGGNCLGPGNAANTTTGRAVRLCLQNIGGATAPLVDRSTLGSPAKITYCFAESDDVSAWPSLHEDRGFAAHESVVTVFAGEAPHNVEDHSSGTPEGILRTMASSVASRGANNAYFMGEVLLILGPEHARLIANSGWGKQDIQGFVFDQARNSRSDLAQGGLWGMHRWPAWFDALGPTGRQPVVADPRDIVVVVAGGAGRHSACVHSWGPTRSVSRRIPESSRAS